jgi:hypothetical protein
MEPGTEAKGRYSMAKLSTNLRSANFWAWRFYIQQAPSPGLIVKKLSLPIILLAGLALAAGLFAVFSALPPVLPCTYPAAQSLVLALGALLLIYFFSGPRWLPGARARYLAVTAVLIGLVAWLGFYPLSPLGFSTGRIPVLRGFTVVTRARSTVNIAPGAVLTLGSGVPAAIQPVTLPGDMRCTWMSTRGGALDEPSSCAVVYVPPQADYDILKLSLQPGCGLPRSVERIRISILP